MTARSPMARRAALGVLALGTLTACGIHLEEDAPRVPLVPARTPIAGEDALVGLLLGTQTLAAGVALLPKVAGFGAALDQQARVLDSALRERGVPANRLAGAASGTAEVAALAGASVTAAHEVLAHAEVALRPMLASLAASRTVLAGKLDRNWQPPAPAPAALDTPAALAVLAASRAAVYGVEVAAARSADATRERGVSTLHTLRGLVMAQEALLGAQAPPTPSAYGLPVTVTDNASAKRLVGHLLDALTRAYAGQLPTVADAPPALLTLTDWLAASAQLQSRWGADLAAFPGLT